MFYAVVESLAAPCLAIEMHQLCAFRDGAFDIISQMKSWNEIRKAATAFSKRWKSAFDEKSQAQSFLKEFFEVFGVDTVTQATFEHRVKFSDGSQGFVDCFWPSTILVEMRSKGKNLDAAFGQAMDYVRALPDQSTLPRAIVVSNFQTFRFYDLTKDAQLTTFKLADLRKYVTLFGYMIGDESIKASPHLPWQFYICKGTREQLVAMLEEFDKHGIESVETMARWKWCKMKGNT